MRNAERYKDDLKLIRHVGGGVDRPDDESMPYLLTAELDPPKFMKVTFVCLFGGSEIVHVRAKTAEAARWCWKVDLRGVSRLREAKLINTHTGETLELDEGEEQ